MQGQDKERSKDVGWVIELPGRSLERQAGVGRHGQGGDAAESTAGKVCSWCLHVHCGLKWILRTDRTGTRSYTPKAVDSRASAHSNNQENESIGV